MSDESLAVVPSVWGRAARLLRRAVVSLTVVGCAGSLLVDQARRFQAERYFDHPLIAALDEVDASVQGTHLVATGEVLRGPEPTMAELKAFAARLAYAREGAPGVELWSEVGTGYRVVYYRGRDEAGGSWTASARYIAGPYGGEGVVELALRRDLVGRYDELRRALHAMSARMHAAAGRPLPAVSLELRLEARPPAEVEPELFVSALLDAVGARRVAQYDREGVYAVAGYSPRLAGAAPGREGPVNLVVEFARRGQGSWLTVGTPTL